MRQGRSAASTIRGLRRRRRSSSAAPAGAPFTSPSTCGEDSETYLDWVGVELSAESGRQILMPHGCAAGYQALVDDAEVAYASDTPYSPEHEGGLRFDDPRLGIEWPLEAQCSLR